MFSSEHKLSRLGPYFPIAWNTSWRSWGLSTSGQSWLCAALTACSSHAAQHPASIRTHPTLAGKWGCNFNQARRQHLLHKWDKSGKPYFVTSEPQVGELLAIHHQVVLAFVHSGVFLWLTWSQVTYLILWQATTCPQETCSPLHGWNTAHGLLPGEAAAPIEFLKLQYSSCLPPHRSSLLHCETAAPKS